MNFWRCMCAALAVFFVGLNLLPTPPRYAWEAPLGAKIAAVLVMVLGVTIVWAIVFRRQVEKLQVSVLSLLVLLTMQAVLLWAMQRLGPY